MLQKLKEYFIPERRLFYSVTIGWSLIILTVVALLLSANFSFFDNLASLLILLTPIYLCIRYSTFGPVIKSTASGFTVVAGVSIIDYIFSRRDTAGSLTFGALIGVLIAVFFILVWNTIKAIYYLIKETITFFQYKDIVLTTMKKQSVA